MKSPWITAILPVVQPPVDAWLASVWTAPS
jgi:hypothetical protein